MRYYFKKGFTLIELMVAVFILTVGIGGVLQIFPLGIQIGKSAQMTTSAAELGQGEMEEIISKSYDEIPVGTTAKTPFSSPFTSYQKQIKVSYVNPNNGLQETISDLEVKKIEITIFWESSLEVAEKSLKIISLIAKR
jgi:prepilin-type N-terminal cleavage/methylation domain-containing protein